MQERYAKKPMAHTHTQRRQIRFTKDVPYCSLNIAFQCVFFRYFNEIKLEWETQSLGTCRICEFMFYLRWCMRLPPLQPRLWLAVLPALAGPITTIDLIWGGFGMMTHQRSTQWQCLWSILFKMSHGNRIWKRGLQFNTRFRIRWPMSETSQC